MQSIMHVLEGKIFVHHRRNEILKIIRGGYEYGCYFECFIGAKNFIGHFMSFIANQVIKSESYM